MSCRESRRGSFSVQSFCRRQSPATPNCFVVRVGALCACNLGVCEGGTPSQMMLVTHHHIARRLGKSIIVSRIRSYCLSRGVWWLANPPPPLTGYRRISLRATSFVFLCASLFCVETYSVEVQIRGFVRGDIWHWEYAKHLPSVISIDFETLWDFWESRFIPGKGIVT